MKNVSTKSGFTIVELMVTLAVAAILMGFAVPAFNDFIRQRSMAAAVNDFVLAVTYARSEAVRRGDDVSVTSRGSQGNNEWGEGYCVAVGTPGDCDDPDDVLREFDPVDDNVTFNATGAGWHNNLELTFNGRGMLASQPAAPGVIELCSDDVDPGRVVNITVIGRPDVEELECNP